MALAGVDSSWVTMSSPAEEETARACDFCQAHFSPRTAQQKFCNPSCRKSAYAPNGSRRGVHRLTSAAISQALVTTDLMEKGYEVYRAASTAYPADLVAIDGARFVRVKVKTLRRRADSSTPILEVPAGVDTQALVVDGAIHYQKASGARFVSTL